MKLNNKNIIGMNIELMNQSYVQERFKIDHLHKGKVFVDIYGEPKNGITPFIFITKEEFKTLLEKKETTTDHNKTVRIW